MKPQDPLLHVLGQSVYVDDLPEPAGMLHAAVFGSPIAHGLLRGLDVRQARAIPGVVAIVTAADVPGRNQIGGMVQDEPLLADGAVHFVGQPVACVVATSREAAHRGVAALTADIDELPGVFEPREAHRLGQLIIPSRTMARGDVDAALATAAVVVRGQTRTGSQEHLYLETQGALAVPEEGGRVRIVSSTQAPTAVQRAVAGVLGVGMHDVEVDVTRLGGGFGGKEDQATPWAALAGLAAWLLRAPVKLVLSREDDMRMTGKRHPYDADYAMGLTGDGDIVAWQVEFFQNAGASADLSPAVLERSLLHATASYGIANVRAIGHCCRTNLPPFTAFRGFGGPQAMFVMESALDHAARVLGVDRSVLQQRNLTRTGDVQPCGMPIRSDNAVRTFEQVISQFGFAAKQREIAAFNAANRRFKRGAALMPVCFGISFTTTFLNQASALVHVYTDGSIAVSTGAVEMGQGVNAKIQAAVAGVFGVADARVRLESTNTARAANTSPTAASSGADLNAAAAAQAARAIAERLKSHAAALLECPESAVALADGRVTAHGAATEWTFEKLAQAAYFARVSLSAQAHYATPGILFNRATESGVAFAYHVFGTALTEVTLDALLGTYTIDRVSCVHDVGTSLRRDIDRGQVEGGIVQGVGWMTMEEVVYRDGKLQSANLGTYKVPDILAAPALDVAWLEEPNAPSHVTGKAVGEPPLMYGIGAYFALLNAVRAAGVAADGMLEAPMTPERALLLLCGERP